MKLSVSLSDDDVAILDAYVERAGLQSRSAGMQHAVQMLRYPTLEDDYADAWAQWATEDDAEAWEGVAGDGIRDVAR